VIPEGTGNITITLSFDLTAMSESDYERLQQLSQQLASLHRRTQQGGKPNGDSVNGINLFTEDSDEPVH
jgi:hypothetical protein